LFEGERLVGATLVVAFFVAVAAVVTGSGKKGDHKGRHDMSRQAIH
jgi:hypothetical protein